MRPSWLSASAETVAGVGDVITGCDAERRFAYANPAAGANAGEGRAEVNGAHRYHG